MSYAWLEVSHSLNLSVTFGFWAILIPFYMITADGKDQPHSDYPIYDYFIFWHMVILHSTPLIMTSLNVYFTDIKLLSADWKLMVFHGVFYCFANMLGQFDSGRSEYGPLTDWENDPGLATSMFVFGIPTIIVGFYMLFCHFQWKRRGEK